MHEEKGQPPAESQATDPIESMMASGEMPSSGRARARDLGADALAAARAAQAPPAAASPSAAPRGAAAPGAPARREWFVRALLALNLALVGAVLALPLGRRAEPEGSAPPAQEPRTEPAPTKPQTFSMGEQSLYLRGLELAANGQFDDAIGLLEAHLKANPYMGEVEQRLVYHALAMFAVRAGRGDDANRYEAAMDKLRVGAQLPQDLLDLARQAEADGRGGDMRRYYARFLLQQKQVPPSLRDRIAEAYLKLGDGYRIEAERGAEREAARKRSEAPDVAPPSAAGSPSEPPKSGQGSGEKSGGQPPPASDRKERHE